MGARDEAAPVSTIGFPDDAGAGAVEAEATQHEAMTGRETGGSRIGGRPDQGSRDGELADAVAIKTLLVFDLVDSTQLLDELGDARAFDVLARHDRLARDLIVRHEGREIDKTDGFLILFEQTRDAVRCALAYHDELGALARQLGIEIKARAGVHTGEVLLRANTPDDVARGAKPLEVEGLAKPLAARVTALAQGGQTLLTRKAHEAAREALAGADDGLRWASHGTYYFKGVTEAVRIFEVGRAGVAPFSRPPDTVKAYRRRWRWLPAVAMLAAVTLAAVTLFRETLFPSLAVSDARPSIAVLGFKNLGHPEAAWLSTALAELFSADLAASGELRLIPGENVARMKRDLALPAIETLAQDTLQGIRRNLGADYVVLGSYLVLGQGHEGQLQVQVQIQETRSGTMLASVPRRGVESDLFELVLDTSSSLRDSLGFKALTEAEAVAVRGVLPSTTEATRLYSEGLDKLRSFETLAARDLLEQAVAVDPGYALAHRALSEAWTALGDDARAEASARRAFELARGLPREEFLAIEGHYYETASQWQKAVEAYEVLWGFFPDNVEYGLGLAQARSQGVGLDDALRVIDELRRRLPEPARDDPRIDLKEASLAYYKSDYPRQLAAAERALVKSQANQSRVLLAFARAHQGSALRWLGRLDEAESAWHQARELFTATGHRIGVATSLNALGNLRYQVGDLTSAEDLYRQSLAISRDNGTRDQVSSVLNNLGELLRLRGDLAAADEVLAESIAIALEIGRRQREAVALDDLANVRRQQGDLTRAAELALRSRQHYEDLGRPAGLVWSNLTLARTALAAGDVTAARNYATTALDIVGGLSDRSQRASVLHELGAILLASGETAAARERLEEAQAIRSELSEKVSLAETEHVLAGLELEDGRPIEAAAMARKAMEELRREQRPDDEAMSASVLAQALVANGDPEAAAAVLAGAVAWARQSQSSPARLAVTIRQARLLADGGDGTAATRALESAVAETTERGLKALELEARLVLGEIEVASTAGPARPDVVAGHERLAALAKEAAARGFGRIARRAEAASVAAASAGQAQRPSTTPSVAPASQRYGTSKRATATAAASPAAGTAGSSTSSVRGPLSSANSRASRATGREPLTRVSARA